MRITIVSLVAVMLIAGTVGAGPIAPNASDITAAWTFDSPTTPVVATTPNPLMTTVSGNAGGVLGATGYDATLSNWSTTTSPVAGHFGYAGNNAYSTATVVADGQNNNGQAGYVTGNQPVDTGLNLIPGTDTFSVEAWIKTTSTADGTFFARSKSGATRQYQFMISGTGQLQVELGMGASNPEKWFLTSGLTLNDGNWHQVAVVVPTNSANLAMYVDGALVANSQSATSVYGGQTTSLDEGIMGRRNNDAGYDSPAINGNLPDTGQNLPGAIDELTVFHTALTADNVAWLDQNSVETLMSPTPEPATMSMLILGGIGMIGGAIRRRKVA